MSLLDQHLRSLAQSDPERLITVCQGRRRTSAGLESRIGRLTWALRHRLGFRPGDRVALVSLGTDFFLEALLACIRAGLVAVLVNWRWSTAEAAQALSLCKPKGLITDSACSFLNLTASITSITATLLIGHQADAAAGTSLVEDLLAAAGNVSLTVESDVQQPAVICFTSGSTGPVKGVTLSQAALHAQSEAKIAKLGYSASDIYLHTAPLFHVGGLASALAMLHVGARQILTPKFSPAQAVQDAAMHHVTSLIAVPAALHDMVEFARAKQQILPSVRMLLIGGAALSPALQQNAEHLFPAARMTLAYGMTEAASSITFQDFPLPQAAAPELQPRHTCVGYPAQKSSVRIQADSRLADARVQSGMRLGEVLIQGPSMMLGYWDDPPANRDAFMPDGTFRTGDIGFLDEQGRLWLAGRLKNLIRSGSESVQATHVQAVLESCPHVVSAAVVGLPDERLGQSVAALVVLPVSQHASAVPCAMPAEQLSALHRHCTAQGLSRFQLPRFVAQQHQPLPTTALGKISSPAVMKLLQGLHHQQQQQQQQKQQQQRHLPSRL